MILAGTAWVLFSYSRIDWFNTETPVGELALRLLPGALVAAIGLCYDYAARKPRWLGIAYFLFAMSLTVALVAGLPLVAGLGTKRPEPEPWRLVTIMICIPVMCVTMLRLALDMCCAVLFTRHGRNANSD